MCKLPRLLVCQPFSALPPSLLGRNGKASINSQERIIMPNQTNLNTIALLDPPVSFLYLIRKRII
jgi:hypothetical protein